MNRAEGNTVRKSQRTLQGMMILVAAVAVLLLLYRWSSRLSLTVAFVTSLPSFAWANTGGKIWWTGGKTWWTGQTPRGTFAERLGLFALTWFFSTIGMFAFLYLVLQIQGVSLRGL